MFDTLKTTDSGDLLQCISEPHAVDLLSTCGPDHLYLDRSNIFVDRDSTFEYTTLRTLGHATIAGRRYRKNKNKTK